MSCDELKKRRDKAWECLSLRDQIKHECYGGVPERGHEHEVRTTFHAMLLCGYYRDIKGCDQQRFPWGFAND